MLKIPLFRWQDDDAHVGQIFITQDFCPLQASLFDRGAQLGRRASSPAAPWIIFRVVFIHHLELLDVIQVVDSLLSKDDVGDMVR